MGSLIQDGNYWTYLARLAQFPGFVLQRIEFTKLRIQL